MDLHKLQSARDEAAAGLEALKQDIEVLRVKADHLAKAVASLNFVLGDSGRDDVNNTVVMTEPLDETSAPSGVSKNDDAYRPTWEFAKEALVSEDRPLTVPELDKVLSERGFTVKRDALRIAMIRRPDTFRRNAYGRWGLVTWPTSSANSDLSHFAADGTVIGDDDDEADSDFSSALSSMEAPAA